MTAVGQKRLFVVNGSRPEDASNEEETPADTSSQDAPHQESNLPEAEESGASEQPRMPQNRRMLRYIQKSAAKKKSTKRCRL